jgi:hypothetical protein
VGPVELWTERLTEWYVDLGVDTFIFWPADAETRDVERFAQDVVPAVLDATARVRPAGLPLP